MIFRRATPEDYPSIAPFASELNEDTVSAERLNGWDARVTTEGHLSRYIVLADEVAAGYACLERMAHHEPGRYSLKLYLAPEFRGQGHGSAWLCQLEDTVRSMGGTAIESETRDDWAFARDFAAAKGYVETGHEFVSEIDLQARNAADDEAILARAARNGVRLFSFADTSMDREAGRMLWALNDRIAFADDPYPRPFEQFERDVLSASWFEPAAQFLAARGDEWVGIGAVAETSPGVYYNMFTGVLPEHRGLGIASALKVQGLRYAAAKGARVVRTNNSSTNAPMLAVNRRLGYVPLPGWIQLRKELL